MNSKEHRAKAEAQLAQAELLVEECREEFESYGKNYALAAHLRQCAIVHAVLSNNEE